MCSCPHSPAARQPAPPYLPGVTPRPFSLPPCALRPPAAALTTKLDLSWGDKRTGPFPKGQDGVVERPYPVVLGEFGSIANAGAQPAGGFCCTRQLSLRKGSCAARLGLGLGVPPCPHIPAGTCPTR